MNNFSINSFDSKHNKGLGMASPIRIAICQISCHPAIYCGQQMWLEEPFVPQNKLHSLSHLSIQGFDVSKILQYCKNTYIDWQAKRIAGILNFLKNLRPTPSIILFPEGAIPFQCLKLLHSFSTNTETTVFGGTHSLLNLKELNDVYDTIGISAKKRQRIREKSSSHLGVAPIFVGRKAHLINKKILAPFEKTDITDTDLKFEILHPFEIPINSKHIPVLALICAEALNFPKLKIMGDYNICVMLSYDSDPERFSNVIEMLSGNKKVVAYCNDGRFGGSQLRFPIDKRPQFWWFDSDLKGRLPKGDAILIADVDPYKLGIEVGVTSPVKNFKEL